MPEANVSVCEGELKLACQNAFDEQQNSIK